MNKTQTTILDNIAQKGLPKSSYLIIGRIDSDKIFEIFNVPITDRLSINDPKITIEQVRNLRYWISLRPINNKIKVAVIENADNMGHEAANALLKTLEEPPPYATLFLVAADEGKILPTIKSRCEKIRLPLDFSLEKTEDYVDPQELGQMPYFKRFEIAAILSESPNLEAILTLWLEKYRQKLLKGEDTLEILGKILQAKDLLSTNVSLKLLLENLTLYF